LLQVQYSFLVAVTMFHWLHVQFVLLGAAYDILGQKLEPMLPSPTLKLKMEKPLV